MNEIESIKKEITEIKLRNQKVELDKRWETSFTRKIFIAVITYVLIGIYMIYLDVDKPWLNAIIPTTGYLLSTLTLSMIKEWWVKRK